MKTFSERTVFLSAEVTRFKAATVIVQDLPDVDQHGRELRCHEVARHVGRLLGLEHIDGKCCHVDHTWLVTPDNILDVYAVGRMPPVQLIYAKSQFPPISMGFERGEERDDIRADTLDWLAKQYWKVDRSPENLEAWGLYIRTRRKLLGLTQEQLAGKIGVTLRSVIRWEGGMWPKSFVVRQKLEAVLRE